MAGTLTISTLSDGTNSTSSTNCIQGSAKAWVNYNITGQSIYASYNVSSVTYNATGDFTVNFTNAFSDTKYCVVGMSGYSSASTNPTFIIANRVASTGALQAPTTTTCRINADNQTGNAQNADYVGVAFLR